VTEANIVTGPAAVKTPDPLIATADVLEQFKKDKLVEPTYKTDNDIVKGAQAAWLRLKQNQTWQDWLLIGEAHLIGRTEAMRKAGTNQPTGRSYNAAFSRGLKATNFDGIDKGDRARLFEVMKHKHEIEQWRGTLPTSQQLSLNYPPTVLRKWKASTRIPAEPRLSPMAKLQAAHAEQIEENHRLKREIELGGGDLWTAKDRPDEIARVMVDKLSPTKAEHVARAILRRLKEHRARSELKSGDVASTGADQHTGKTKPAISSQFRRSEPT
jgi:hypothetical protein